MKPGPGTSMLIVSACLVGLYYEHANLFNNDAMTSTAITGVLIHDY